MAGKSAGGGSGGLSAGESLALAASMSQGAKAAIEQARALGQANKALSEWLSGLTQHQQAQALATAAAGKLKEAQAGIASVFERGKATLMGWATAGLAGTTMGERLLFQQQMLRREISQLFLPAIEQVSKWLDTIAQKFRGLTKEQQDNIGRWVLTGVAALGTLTLLPRLVAGIESLKKGWTALSVVFAANPFFLGAAGVALLMGQTQEGRKSLAEMGKAAVAAFSSIGDALTPLTWLFERLSEFFSGTIGKITVWSAVFVTAIYAVKAAFSSMALTMLGATSVLGLMIAAVAALAAAFGKSETRKFQENIAGQVRSGRLTLEEANEEVRKKAEEKAFERKEEGKPWHARPAWLGGENAEEFRNRVEREKAETIAEGLARNRRAAKGGKDRNELLLAQTAQEDPRQTIQRIQSAALKVSDPTAEHTKKTADLTEAILRFLQGRGGGDRDNRDKPLKED